MQENSEDFKLWFRFSSASCNSHQHFPPSSCILQLWILPGAAHVTFPTTRGATRHKYSIVRTWGDVTCPGKRQSPPLWTPQPQIGLTLQKQLSIVGRTGFENFWNFSDFSGVFFGILFLEKRRGFFIYILYTFNIPSFYSLQRGMGVHEATWLLSGHPVRPELWETLVHLYDDIRVFRWYGLLLLNIFNF